MKSIKAIKLAHGGKRQGAGRKESALTVRTRKAAERAIATGTTPLEVMLDNMLHFQRVAHDAEATLNGLTAAEFSEQVPDGASPEEQFKFLLAQVKKTAGFRQLAQEAASDAAPYMHAKLAALTLASDPDKPLVVRLERHIVRQNAKV